MITTEQGKLLRFLHAYTKEHDGTAPSYIEMREHLGLVSSSGVHRLILGLEKREFIRRKKGLARAIEVLRLPESIGPTEAKPRLKLADLARVISEQDWCAADAETVLACMRSAAQ